MVLLAPFLFPLPASNGVDLGGEAASRSLEAALEVARSSRRIDLGGEAASRNRSRSREV